MLHLVRHLRCHFQLSLGCRNSQRDMSSPVPRMQKIQRPLWCSAIEREFTRFLSCTWHYVQNFEYISVPNRHHPWVCRAYLLCKFILHRSLYESIWSTDDLESWFNGSFCLVYIIFLLMWKCSWNVLLISGLGWAWQGLCFHGTAQGDKKERISTHQNRFSFCRAHYKSGMDFWDSKALVL